MIAGGGLTDQRRRGSPTRRAVPEPVAGEWLDVRIGKRRREIGRAGALDAPGRRRSPARVAVPPNVGPGRRSARISLDKLIHSGDLCTSFVRIPPFRALGRALGSPGTTFGGFGRGGGDPAAAAGVR